eukprot:TRINITY_DN748_c0_g1_i1.p1 TRINITY_DN748_c0_g1~~TRINITY_DN748_c0_g1_i1.p1  ORF type:complete len:113 (-),score=17.20 TRINITY_DN748_c0_g1_i1:40-378(-)
MMKVVLLLVLACLLALVYARDEAQNAKAQKATLELLKNKYNEALKRGDTKAAETLKKGYEMYEANRNKADYLSESERAKFKDAASLDDQRAAADRLIRDLTEKKKQKQTRNT